MKCPQCQHENRPRRSSAWSARRRLLSDARTAGRKAEQAKQAASAAVGAEKALGTRVEAVGAVTVGTPAKSSALALGEEREPNDHITAANRITVGTTIRGQLTTDEDRDFFAFKTSAQSAGRIRVILRKRFNAHIVVYDAAERQLARDGEEGDTPVSLSFESRPNADYYVLVKSARSAALVQSVGRSALMGRNVRADQVIQ